MESVKELKAKLAKAKRNVSRLERELVRAEKLEKEAQEIERARKIIALLETNKGKRVIVEWTVYVNEEDRFTSASAEELVLTFNVNKWAIGSPRENGEDCYQQ